MLSVLIVSALAASVCGDKPLALPHPIPLPHALPHPAPLPYKVPHPAPLPYKAPHPAPLPYKPAPPAPYAPPHPHPAPYKEEAKPYAYEYGVIDEYSGNNFNAHETADGKVVTGSYQVHLPDGRIQTVTYTADHYNGYVADVKYEGTPIYPEYKPKPYAPPPHPAPYKAPHPAPYKAPIPHPPPPAPYKAPHPVPSYKGPIHA